MRVSADCLGTPTFSRLTYAPCPGRPAMPLIRSKTSSSSSSLVIAPYRQAPGSSCDFCSPALQLAHHHRTQVKYMDGGAPSFNPCVAPGCNCLTSSVFSSDLCCAILRVVELHTELASNLLRCFSQIQQLPHLDKVIVSSAVRMNDLKLHKMRHCISTHAYRSSSVHVMGRCLVSTMIVEEQRGQLIAEANSLLQLPAIPSASAASEH